MPGRLLETANMPRSLLKPFRKSVASEDRPSAPQDSTHALRVGSCSFGGLPVGTSHAPAVSGSQNARPVSVLCDLLGAAPSALFRFSLLQPDLLTRSAGSPLPSSPTLGQWASFVLIWNTLLVSVAFTSSPSRRPLRQRAWVLGIRTYSV